MKSPRIGPQNAIATLFLVAVVLLAFRFRSVSAGMTFHSPKELENRTIHAPEWLCTGKRNAVVTGRLLCLPTLVNEHNYTIEQLKQNYTGGILLVSSTNFFDGEYPPLYKLGNPERVLLEVTKLFNLSAVLIHNTAAVVGATAEVLVYDKSWCPQIGIPIFETGLVAGSELVDLCATNASVNPIIVTMTTGDFNEWMYLKRGWFLIVFRIVATLLAATAGSLAGAKLIAYVRTQGFRANVPQIVLAIQFIAALFRISITSTDPIYAGLYFNAVGAHLTSTISFPLNFITILLLAFYWSEMLNASKLNVAQFLTKLKIPFIIASALLVVAELFSTLLRTLQYTGLKVAVASTLTAVLYIIYMFIMTLLFFVYGFKVIFKLKRSRKMSNMKGGEAKSAASLRRMTTMLVATGCFNILFIISFPMVAFESFFYTPTGFHISWSLMYLGLLGASVSQVAAVKWPEPSDRSTTLGGSYRQSSRDSNMVSPQNSQSAV